MKDIEKLIENDEIFFCHMPWTMVYSEVTGNWQACCHAKEQFELNIENTSPEEWMKSDQQNKLRKEMLDPNTKGEMINKVCGRCVKEERLYNESRRLRKLRNFKESLNGSKNDHYNQYANNILKAVKLFDLTNEFEFEYRVLETEVKIFGMQCNLDCHMCHPRHSTTRQKTQLENNLISEEVFRSDKEYIQRQVDEALKTYSDNVVRDEYKTDIEKLMDLAPYTFAVKIIGGEPLVMKKQYEYLQALIDSGDSKHISIKYQTNMAKLGTGKHKVVDFIPHFKNFFFTASIDSMGDAIEYCRRRTNWDELLQNIITVKKFPNVVVDVNSVMGFLSILRYYEFLEFMKDNEDLIEPKLSVYCLEYPPHLQVRNLPQKIKDDLIPKYKDWPDIQAMLKQPNDGFGTVSQLQHTFKYLLTQDEFYKGTKHEKNLFEVFPELEEHYKPEEIGPGGQHRTIDLNYYQS